MSSPRHYRRLQRRIQNRQRLSYEPRYADTTHLISDFLKRAHFPECHGGQFAHNGSYSPLLNDIWSLGNILLNLLTGRNPWKSASLSDPTFYAYLQDPARFLPTVLPISDEVNALLVRVLDIDWRRRLTVTEMKESVKQIDNFYSDDVVFKGSMARCTWVVEASKTNASVSQWSPDSKSDSSMVFASYSATQKAA